VTDPTAVAGCHRDPALVENVPAIMQCPSKDKIVSVDPDASSALIITPQYRDGLVFGKVVQQVLFL
jgi:hypothetical protein